MQELQARLNTSREKRATLQHAHDEHRQRIIGANGALSAIAVQAQTHQLAYPAGATPRCNPAGEPAPALSQPPIHNAITRLPIQHSQAPTLTMIRSCSQRGLGTDPHTPPPTIQSFKHSTGVSYDLLYKAASSLMEDSPVHQSSRSIVEEFKRDAAKALQCSTSQVCWFVVTYLEAAPGVHLSFSSSLSSPECVASFVLSFLCSGLEFGMVTAALDAKGMSLPLHCCYPRYYIPTYSKLVHTCCIVPEVLICGYGK